MDEDSNPFPSLDAIEDDAEFCEAYGIGPFDLTYKFVLRSYEHGSRVMEDMHAILAGEFGEADVSGDANPVEVARGIADALERGTAREFSLAQAIVLLLQHRNDIRSNLKKFDSPDPKVRADGFRQYLIDSGGMRNYDLFTTQGARGARYRGGRRETAGTNAAGNTRSVRRALSERPPATTFQKPLVQPAVPAEPVGFETHAPWIDDLIRSPELTARRVLAGRTALPDDRIRDFLQAIEERGGTATRAAIALRLGLTPVRMAGIVAMMQRLLNLDGYAVLSIDEESDSIALNLSLLRVQFGVGG